MRPVSRSIGQGHGADNGRLEDRMVAVAESEIPLAGGWANQGAVVRVGETVRRPQSSPAVQALLLHLADVGFEEAPRFLGIDDSGREVLSWIEGEVALPPFPLWIAARVVLEEVARLIARYHQAVSGFELGRHRLSADLGDPQSGPIVCHNDVCVENVVFRDGRAVGLLDFEFAAPGRALWDLAMAARMWAPLTHPRFRSHWPGGLDAAERLATFAGAYGVDAQQADEFVDVVLETRRIGISFVRARAESGQEPFVEEWSRRGGDERMTVDDAWIAETKPSIVRAVRAARAR